MAFPSLWRKGVTHAGDQLLSGSGILGLLIQPQLQSFVFKGLDITAGDVEEGAEQAVKMVYAHRNTGDADAPRLLSLCEPRLCSKMAAADCAEWPRPALQRIDGVTLDHVRIIVGGQRETFSPTKTAEENAAATGITPTSVGRDMVILSRDADFEGVSDMVRRFLFLDYTEQYLRSLLVDHGMTVQFAVDVNCVLNAPSSSAAPGDEEQEAAFPVEPAGTQEVCQRWVFESPMDAQFKQNLDWRVVDVNNVMDGAQFWAEK